jgi:hypothetical protein
MFGSVQSALRCKTYDLKANCCMQGELKLSDVYVYYFMRRGPAGENLLSVRRATLDTIKSKGNAVMESQIVVDHTEVDGDGFLIGGVDSESHPRVELWAQIRSLERRANSRDNEALTLDENAEGRRIYSLHLESRELRKQAQRLKQQRADAMTGELDNRSDAHDFVPFGGSPTTG